MFAVKRQICLVACLILLAVAPAQAAFVVGGFDATRAGVANVINGIYSEDTIAATVDSFPGMTFAATPKLTPEFLSGINVLVLTPASSETKAITALSASEQAALLDFVKAGGSALLICELTTFLPASQSFLSPFGVTAIDDNVTGLITTETTQPSHPVVNGPFGAVPGALMYGAVKFSNVGPYAQTIMTNSANGDSVLAVIESHALGPNSGRVVMIADGSVFIDGNNGGLFGVQEHRSLFLNSINFLAVPEPSTLTLLGIAAAISAVGVTTRRIKSRAKPNR